MSNARFFESYRGETTEQLLSLVGEYRIDSLVLAFERAIQLKAAHSPLSRQERYVLAIEALEREVNNGGYRQFFLNSSHEFIDMIEEALKTIGCPKTSLITRDAITALNITGPVNGRKAEEAILADDQTILNTLSAFDSRYYDTKEAITERLFAWISENQGLIKLGND